MSGLDVLRRLRAGDERRVDVIAVTAAKDVETLRTAIHGGVIHYLVKPFFFDTLRERLERYAALRSASSGCASRSQEDIDHVFSLLRTQGRHSLPKGISAPTLDPRRRGAARREGRGDRQRDRRRAGVSRGTARRYLEYLAATGAGELSLRYGATGRPEHLYRLAEAPR